MLKEASSVLAAIALAVMAAAGVQLTVEGGSVTSLVAPSILMTLLTIPYWVLYRRFKRSDIRMLAVVLALLFSVLLTLGGQLDRVGDIAWGFMTLFKVLCLALALFPLLTMLIRVLDARCLRSSSESTWPSWTHKTSWSVFGVVLVVELIVLAALYPGVYGYDASSMILSATDPTVPLRAHFSVPYALLIGSLVSIGQAFLGAPEHGLALLMALQAVSVALMISRIAHCTWLIAGNRLLTGLSVLFFVLNPLFVVQVVSSSPDVFFCACFGCIAAELVLLGCGKAENRLSSYVRLAAVSLALMLLRNNGVYVLAVVVVVLAVMAIKDRAIPDRAFALAIAVPICLYFLITGPVYAMAGVEKGDSLKEMMSVPVQQLARVYHYPVKTADRNGELSESPYRNDSLRPSDEMLAQIESFFEEPLPIYETKPLISDNQKSILKTDELEGRPLDFLQLYLRAGSQYPQEYLEAFLLNSLGFWYPDKAYPDARMYHPLIEYRMIDAKWWNEAYTPMERTSLIPPLDTVLRLLVGNAGANRLPVVSTLFNPGTYFFLFAFVCGYAVHRRKRARAFLPFLSLLAALFLVFLLSPVCIYRYCIPFISCAPLLVALLVSLSGPDRNDDGFIAR